MRKLVIDRFDGKYAICEGEGKDGEIRKFAIPMQEVPKDASEGVCIVINDEGEIAVDHEETEKRKAQILLKEKKLIK